MRTAVGYSLIERCPEAAVRAPAWETARAAAREAARAAVRAAVWVAARAATRVAVWVAAQVAARAAARGGCVEGRLQGRLCVGRLRAGALAPWPYLIVKVGSAYHLVCEPHCQQSLGDALPAGKK